MGVGAAARKAIKAIASAGGAGLDTLGSLRRLVPTRARRVSTMVIKDPPTPASLARDDDILTKVAADVDAQAPELKTHPLDIDPKLKGSSVNASKWNKVLKYGVTPGVVIATVGAATYLTIAGVHLQNTDGVEVKITKITKGNNQFKVEYKTQGGQQCGPSGAKVNCIQSAFNPSKGDYFTFRNTHTNPGLDGQTLKVIGSESSHDVIIEGTITDAGDGVPEWGYMTCSSSFENQFHDSVRDTVKLIVDVAFDVADGARQGICDNVQIPILCSDGGFNWWIVALIILICCCCCIAMMVLASTLK